MLISEVVHVGTKLGALRDKGNLSIPDRGRLRKEIVVAITRQLGVMGKA